MKFLNEFLLKVIMLLQEACQFFKEHLNKDLEMSDKMEFVDLWYVMIFINDILTIVGSILKIMIENKVIF